MIQKRNLHPSLIQWIQSESGLGPGIGDVHFLVAADSATTYFNQMLGEMGVENDHIHTSLTNAYNALGSFRNDILVVMPNSGFTSGTTAFTWSKSYTTVIGAAPWSPTHGRSRITLTGADVATAFTISGRGTQWKNVHFQWGNNKSSARTAVSLTYSGNANNVFMNCDFNGPLHATEAAAAYKIVNIASGCQDNAFLHCKFGAWTVQAAEADAYEVYLAGNTGPTVFEDCLFMAYSNEAGHCFVYNAADPGGEAALTLFRRCDFFQGDRDVTLTKVLDSHPTQGCSWFIDCHAYNVTDWAEAASATVKVSAPAANEAGGVGTAVS
jgi:hypothetical protein